MPKKYLARIDFTNERYRIIIEVIIREDMEAMIDNEVFTAFSVDYQEHNALLN